MFIKPLAELGERDLEIAGGKAANLGVLVRAGFPVPGGFCITTRGYEAFIAEHRLKQEIESLVSGLEKDNPLAVQEISARLRALFTGRQIPGKLEDEIRKTFTDYDFPYCAVRSSATTEDLPGLSFAGQQDTYLNIKGITALLDAVRKCWASLWTERAVAYRERNRVVHTEASIAVVVQEMVPADASGVLFTANPLTGKRTEMVIDAVSGLGEALVSGLVEPDHYVIDSETGRITGKVIGEKKVSIRGLEMGGTGTVEEGMKDKPASGDEQIGELIQLGRKAVEVFHSPQDMEWAWAGGKMYILQSRPITSLYPLPDNMPGNRLFVLFSFGAVQGMLDPFTPLGGDMFRYMAIAMANFFGKQVTSGTQRAMFTSGMRLFFNFTPLFRSEFGRRFLQVVISFGEPGSRKTIETLFQDSRLSVKKRFMKIGTFAGFCRIFIPIIFNTILNLLFPARARYRIQLFIKRLVSGLSVAHAPVKTLAERIRLIEKTISRIPLYLITRLIPAVACGQAPLQLLRGLCKDLPDSERLVMQLTHGLPYNVTTEMDLRLWQIACRIKADEESYTYFRQNDPAFLSAAYTQGKLPGAAGHVLDEFMKIYGMRGVAEIDLGRPRWKETPDFLFRIIKSYLEITDPGQAPDVVFQRGIASAEEAGTELVKMLARGKNGKRKAHVASVFIRKVRRLTGFRETPKFAAIKAMTVMRDGLLADAVKLAGDGLIAEPGDIFYLHLEDLKKMAGNEKQDWKAIIRRNKEEYAREKLRRLIPRLMLSDGTAFYEGLGAHEEGNPDIIQGSPVSPGVAEGIVHVVFDPAGEQLSPGEILVCPGTDPAWTPLFLTASGLVMEVGGMMTHGAVVAREYGIPAVVGVGQATTRFQTGQRVRIDGSEGLIEIIR